MTKTEFNKLVSNVLSSEEDYYYLLDTLGSIATVMGDRSYLKGGTLKREFKHGRLTIKVDLSKGK